jgi:protocatechuate 3,4-dioxygenase beta subunit
MPPSPRPDEHDLGLALDLATLRSRSLDPRLSRRHALRVLAGAGAGVVLAACGSDGGSSASPSTAAAGATSTTLGSSPSGTAGAGAEGAVVPVPEETGGPYPGDGSNGPNVLVESGVVRRDIRSSFGSYSGTAEGVPLTIALRVVDAATGAPLEGSAVYAWHCTRDGGYSLYTEGITDQNFLRGVQVAGADGNLTFDTIFPGAYSGRWPHVHFQVFADLDAAASGDQLVTSQLALPEDACAAVYATSGYDQSAANLARTSLSSDMVFSDGIDQQLATITGDPARAGTATLLVAV